MPGLEAWAPAQHRLLGSFILRLDLGLRPHQGGAPGAPPSAQQDHFREAPVLYDNPRMGEPLLQDLPLSSEGQLAANGGKAGCAPPPWPWLFLGFSLAC
jgi:hypothetical protein